MKGAPPEGCANFEEKSCQIPSAASAEAKSPVVRGGAQTREFLSSAVVFLLVIIVVLFVSSHTNTGLQLMLGDFFSLHLDNRSQKGPTKPSGPPKAPRAALTDFFVSLMRICPAPPPPQAIVEASVPVAIEAAFGDQSTVQHANEFSSPPSDGGIFPRGG